jgi:predicted RNA methylase
MNVLAFPGFPPPPDASLSQFDTPRQLADRIVEWAGVEKGMRVLEPSAGLGSLALAAQEKHAEVRCIEWAKARAVYLQRQGLTVTQANFLEVPASRGFDLVLINPPYEAGADSEHVEHALRFAPRLVGLLDIGILAGVENHRRLWARHGIRRMAVLSRRPKFSGLKGSGSFDSVVVEVISGQPQLSCALEWWS